MVAQIDLKYIRARPTKLISRLVSYALFEGRPLTTRGQWINPLLFAHFALEKRLPQLRKVRRPLFILGTGRSGTTILGIVLSMHRDVGFLNEPKALWHAIYPFEDVIGSYSRGEASYCLGAQHANQEVTRNAHRLFASYLSVTASSRLVDKYPELVFRVPFVRKIFPDAQFVFLVRNGWDTCASIEKWSTRCGKQDNGEVHDWWGVDKRKWNLMLNELVDPDPYFANIRTAARRFDNHTDMAALEWVVTMREGMRRLREHDTCMYLLRYEDLIKHPRQELSNLASFAGLSVDEKFLEYGESVLSPVPRHQEFGIHSELRPLFDETMRSLGY